MDYKFLSAIWSQLCNDYMYIVHSIIFARIFSRVFFSLPLSVTFSLPLSVTFSVVSLQSFLSFSIISLTPSRNSDEESPETSSVNIEEPHTIEGDDNCSESFASAQGMFMDRIN